MPKGPGTYGSKVGRPKKKTRKMQMGGAAMPMPRGPGTATPMGGAAMPMPRTGTMGPRRMMGGGSMKKKGYAQGGKVIKGPHS